MNKPSRHCINCRHFTRTFNQFIDERWLTVNKVGHCIIEPPRGRDAESYYNESLTGKKEINLLLYVPPVVYEDFVCGKFEPKEETQTKTHADEKATKPLVAPWKKNKQGDDK